MSLLAGDQLPQDEKLPLIASVPRAEQSSDPKRRKPIKHFIIDWTICTGLTLLIFSFALSVLRYQDGYGNRQYVASDEFTGDNDPVRNAWSKIKSHKHLHYQPCFEDPDLQCARLRVPLDWQNAPDSGELEVAVIRLPAPVPVDDPRYGGAVIMNPGGPGGSGVDFVLYAGRVLQAILSSGGEDRKYFDILSFDPRGVGRSTPHARCITDNTALYPWTLRMSSVGIIGSSDNALTQLFSMVHADGEMCVESESTNTIKEHMTTVSVARDMLELVERHGEWREQMRRDKSSTCPLKRLPVLSQWLQHGSDDEDASPRYNPALEKLQYWGFSYGTILGATFATMFPSRIDRMALDGVVDLRDYYDVNWSNNLRDTEKTMQYFYDSCAESGPSLCPLADESSTAEDIQSKVETVLHRLKQGPLAVTLEGSPEIVTYSDAKNLIFISLYVPIQLFPLLANTFADLAKGDGASMARQIHRAHVYNCRSELAQQIEIAREATMTIICTDGKSITNESVADMQAHYEHLKTLSPTVAGIWAGIRLACTGYSLRPSWRFEGPFDGLVNTSAPILWIGNTADPVTPVENARTGAKRFVGSKVLRVDSGGHCSTSAGFSTCFFAGMRRYFQEGALPEEDELVCPVDQRPFADMSKMIASMDVDTRADYDSYVKLGNVLKRMALGRGLVGGALRYFNEP